MRLFFSSSVHLLPPPSLTTTFHQNSTCWPHLHQNFISISNMFGSTEVTAERRGRQTESQREGGMERERGEREEWRERGEQEVQEPGGGVLRGRVAGLMRTSAPLTGSSLNHLRPAVSTGVKDNVRIWDKSPPSLVCAVIDRRWRADGCD